MYTIEYPEGSRHVRSKRQLWGGLAGWLGLCFFAATIGAFASVNAGDFYGRLIAPAWAPPAWLFGPVWTVLYALMGIAAWRVWRNHPWPGAATALTLFVAQLAANALWTWIFFVWFEGALAFAEILMLWGMIVATILTFWRHDRIAAALMLPYLTWVSFAAALNFSLWRANPGLLG